MRERKGGRGGRGYMRVTSKRGMDGVLLVFFFFTKCSHLLFPPSLPPSLPQVVLATLAGSEGGGQMDWVQTKLDQRIRSDLLLTGRKEGREGGRKGGGVARIVEGEEAVQMVCRVWGEGGREGGGEGGTDGLGANQARSENKE